MARKRPTASEARPDLRSTLVARDGVWPSTLTRAEIRALSRSAPLTTAEFKAHRTLAEQRIDPLRVLLAPPAEDSDEYGTPPSS